ncbi:hydroxylysine kinase-like [Synchiropus splendidus]|uniref:hydroxylysine kinase-like n=1 Tax=Synchiropus splendidus TaxID=270530 RepID=UPI00237DC6BC|nr:hydroxylysine kinase-like [Synchiropus splendidus]
MTSRQASEEIVEAFWIIHLTTFIQCHSLAKCQQKLPKLSSYQASLQDESLAADDQNLRKMKTKPNLSESQVVDLVKKLYHLTVTDVQPLPSFDDQNFDVAASDGREYVFKILNSEWTENTTLVGVQTDTMSFLRQNGLPVQNTLPNFKGELICCEDLDCGFGPQKYLVRLLTYLPGVTISKVPPSPQLLLEVGRMAAKIDETLQKMEHPHLCTLLRTEFRWSLSRVPILESYLRFLDEGPVLEMVKSVIQQYETSVAPKYPNFRKCINHGDLNELNILVEPDEKNNFRVSGVLDFVDMTSGYFIHELAITIAHMSTLYCNPAEAGGPVLAGFTSVFPLNEAERDCLYILVLSRLCQVSVLPCYFITLHPENSEYIMGIRRKAAGVLSRLWEQGKERVEKIWFQSAAELRTMDSLQICWIVPDRGTQLISQVWRAVCMAVDASASCTPQWNLMAISLHCSHLRTMKRLYPLYAINAAHPPEGCLLHLIPLIHPQVLKE